MQDTKFKFYFFLASYVALFMYATIVNFSWLVLLGGFVLARLVGVVGVDLGLHRFWTHRAFKSSVWFEYVMMLFAIINLYGSSIMFAGVHRMHHSFSDTDKDPHHGPWYKVLFYVRRKDWVVPLSVISDLARIGLHRWTHKHYFKIHAVLLLLCLIDPIFAGHTLAAVVTFNWLGAGAVNILSHSSFGNRNFDTDDKSTNTWLIQFWSWNEGLHNNHHYKANAYDFAMKPGEIDIPASFLRLLARFNIVTLPNN